MAAGSLLPASTELLLPQAYYYVLNYYFAGLILRIEFLLHKFIYKYKTLVMKAHGEASNCPQEKYYC